MIAGRYSLDSEIGRGGMGVVWRGEDTVLGRDVALKRIGMAPGGTDAELVRAEREARLAASLNHPNVVAVFDLVVDRDEHWLVMEYVESRNLAELVRSRGPLDPDTAARVLGQAADAIAAAHAHGIVHRDVKPSNILVTPHGRVKLTDFGIARTSGDATLTQTGMVTGSPAYIAPEVASGKPATPASDVWSLGAALYHALSGEPPYDVTNNMVGALYRIVHEEPPRLQDAGWLAPVLEATMARDAGERWTMAQVRDHLQAGPDATTTQVAGPAAAGATTTTPLTAVAPAATAAPSAEGTRGTPDIAPTPREKPRPRDRRRLTAWLVGAAATVLAALLVWAAIASTGDDPGTEAQPADPTTSESSPDETPSETDETGETAETAETAETEGTEERPQEATPAAGELTSFAEDYVETAVADPDTSWQMLTPAFQNQSGGRSGYDNWWDQFESAEVSDVSASPDDMTVTYTVDYTYNNGDQTSDTVTLQLVEQGGDLLIAGES